MFDFYPGVPHVCVWMCGLAALLVLTMFVWNNVITVLQEYLEGGRGYIVSWWFILLTLAEPLHAKNDMSTDGRWYFAALLVLIGRKKTERLLYLWWIVLTVAHSQNSFLSRHRRDRNRSESSGRFNKFYSSGHKELVCMCVCVYVCVCVAS